MEISDEWEEIGNEEDVARKRYLMFQLFEKLIDQRFAIENIEPETSEKIGKMKELDGYMYKLSQDFLTNSSTMKKENKLEKIIEHVERKED